jgi:hypothetical protein
MAEAREPAFGPGDEVLLRYLEDPGRVLGAFPVRVVEDTGERVVVWLAPGTTVRYWSTLDGGDPRLVALEDRYRAAHGSTERHWFGSGVLRVIPVHQPYQVVHFWGRGGEFSGWYVNFEQTKHPWGNRIDTIDWQLDLWFGADRRPTWKDEDEAAAAVDAGYLSPDDLALARRTGEGIIGHFDEWLADLGDWRDWRPPAEWTLPELPGDWADPPPA